MRLPLSKSFETAPKLDRHVLFIMYHNNWYQAYQKVNSLFLGARAPLGITHVKKKQKTHTKEKVSNSNNLLSMSAISQLLLARFSPNFKGWFLGPSRVR